MSDIFRTPIIPDQAAIGALTQSALKAIGIGPAFPVAFTQAGSVRAVAVSKGIDKINQSIHLILTTRPGERMMNPEFGSRVPDLIFQQNDLVLRDLLYVYSVWALERWERRIKNVSATFPGDIQDDEEYILRMRLIYEVRATGQAGSYVFPFARQPMPMSLLVRGTPVPAPDRAGATLASPFLGGGAP